VDAPEVAARLTQHPWIASARVVELPKGRLLIDVVERVAVATVNTQDSDAVFAVDANGTPFAPAGDRPAAQLPRLVQRGPIQVGQANSDLAEAVAFIAQLAALGLPRPLEIGVSAPDDPIGYWLRLENFPPRILLGRESLESRLEALARVLEVAPPDAATAAVLDLRFADQVVLRGTPSGKPEAIATGPRAASSGPGASGGRADPKPGG
jgi:cell division septal protein FtsQ